MYARNKETIVDRREMLRVKVKSLAEEARIIRREEVRTWGALRQELQHHRTRDVRCAARAAHLALGFLKGRTLTQMEARRWQGMHPAMAKAMDEALFAEVGRLLKKYGPAGFTIPVEVKKAA